MRAIFPAGIHMSRAGRWLGLGAGLLILATAACASYPQCLGDCVHGRGTLILESGEQYVGEFQNGLRHGYGTLTLRSGAHYSGEWQYNVRHGRGTYVWPNGDKYIGEWRNGKRHGEGTLFYGNGDRETGRWAGGKPAETRFYKAQTAAGG